MDEIKELAEACAGEDRAPWEKELSRLLLTEVLPSAEEKCREAERRARKQRRLQTNLGLGGAYWGEQRSRRSNKVNYAFVGYEEQIRDAIRRTEGHLEKQDGGVEHRRNTRLASALDGSTEGWEEDSASA